MGWPVPCIPRRQYRRPLPVCSRVTGENPRPPRNAPYQRFACVRPFCEGWVPRSHEVISLGVASWRRARYSLDYAYDRAAPLL